MAYSKDKLEKQALAAIEKHKLVFAEEVIAYLPCSSATYYNYGMEKLETIKEALGKNKIDLKGGIRKKMYHSDSATAWIAFYKLMGTDEEVEKLNGSKQKVENSGEVTHNVNLKHDLTKLSDEELTRLKEINKKIAA